ncbi:lipopolysaccharide biosynthesis protein [Micromonospora auratinigra]|uniref:Capsular polysaccharide biosynthesis protein n=1 Tax=Micromonospora auratinigra TaxID=261654 RepID=A0A1A8Z3H6_9ACTN|nr:lipopolysaccharide biosynthesis protein [Micromonospora auratinigra]SBT38329.1 hypothetical protein GA0070611_0509 [Micromonospora auratinigra]
MTDPASSPWLSDGWEAGAAGRTVTITDMLRVPLHRYRLVGGIGLAGLLAALTFILLVPADVTANAVVAVRPVVTDAFTPTGASADRSVNMNVESGIATGSEVTQMLSAEVGRDPKEVRDSLDVEVPTGGQILRFVYRAPTAEEAVKTVNMAARAYLDVRRQMYEKQRGEMLKSYDESIAKVSAQQTALQKRVLSAKGGAADAAVAELAGVNNQLTQLASARSEIAAVDVNPGWLTQTAEPALATRSGYRLLYLVAGLLGGLLIGVVLAYVVESVDRRIRSVTDARDATGLPLLGTVRQRRFPSRGQPVDADVRYVALAIAERVRQPARLALLAAREDVTPLTAGLAVALAADGRAVFVADDSGRAERLRGTVMADRGRLPADKSRPVTPKPRTGPPAAAGSASAPAGEKAGTAKVDGARVPSDPEATMTLPRVAVAAGGGAAAGDPEATLMLSAVSSRRDGDKGRPVGSDDIVVGAGRIRLGTSRQGAEHGLVLFNAPPAETDERGVALARKGTAVVVVERDRTRQGDLRRLVERLRAAGVVPLGFVLTRSGRG